jgi:hypothetical protein
MIESLFYRSGDKMMAVDVATQPSFVAGKPRMLFQGQHVLNPLPSSSSRAATFYRDRASPLIIVASRG